mgnify:CR=1 FL=1
MTEDERLRSILVQLIRAGLWLPIIQTLLWVVHGVREGVFVEWSITAFGPVGDDTALFFLTVLFTLLALLPVAIATWNNKAVKIFVFAFSILFCLAAIKDWTDVNTSADYQYILKAAHTSLGFVGIWFSFRWMRLKH